MRFVTANMNKDLGGDRLYLHYLTELVGRRGVLMLQEVGHGIESTTIEPVGDVKLQQLKTWVVGKVGAHRGVARAKIRLGRRGRVALRGFSAHALHVGSSGKQAQDAYYEKIARRTKWLNRLHVPWLVGTDGNRNLHSVARELGGTAHCDGIVGFIVSPGLRVIAEGSDDTAMRERHNDDEVWSDHPAYWINVVARPGWTLLRTRLGLLQVRNGKN